jgi:uncharacterized membrane protein
VVLALKALHVATLIVWCAGLLALALLLTAHDPQHEQSIYARLRRLTHYSYTGLVTPAAVLAIAAGTALLFARGIFEPWMYAKLGVVGVLVALHAWLGLAVSKIGETAGRHKPPSARLALAIALPAMAAALLLVLAKPSLPPGLLPEVLDAPRYRSLPLDATPT